jgi:hypothetical protein
MAEGNVRVALRIRPLIAREILDRDTVCLTQPDPRQPQVVIGGADSGADGGKVFAFDHVFSLASSQREVFETCVRPLVDSLLAGFNSTILAYGQTGSGKTFTVGLSNVTSLAGSEEEQGIIPRVARALYDAIAAAKREAPAASFNVRVVFLEVYGDDLRDLLNVSASRALAIRETEAGVGVQGAVERTCETVSEMMAVLEEGSLCRTTGSTMMNAHSSRSHAVFTILLDQHVPCAAPADGGEGAPAAATAAGGAGSEGGAAAGATGEVAMEHRVSKFHLLDLAGSERAKRTKATGRRLQEGININLGLLALGNVISALGDEEKRRRGVHVPYRDSKLTRILQDSLGGNSKTLMVACVSPAEANFEESLNTLRYAARARNIKNKPVVNRDAHASQVAQLRAEIEALKLQLAARTRDGAGGLDAAMVGSAAAPGMGVSLPALLGAIGATGMHDVVERLTTMRQAADDVETLRLRANGAEDEIVRLEGELRRTRAQLELTSEEATWARGRVALLEEALLRAGVPAADVAALGAADGVLEEGASAFASPPPAGAGAGAKRGSPAGLPHASPPSPASAALPLPRGTIDAVGVQRLAVRVAELEAALLDSQRHRHGKAVGGADSDDEGGGPSAAATPTSTAHPSRGTRLARAPASAFSFRSTPLMATAAELSSALEGVDHKLLVGFGDDDEEEEDEGEGEGEGGDGRSHGSGDEGAMGGGRGGGGGDAGDDPGLLFAGGSASGGSTAAGRSDRRGPPSASSSRRPRGRDDGGSLEGTPQVLRSTQFRRIVSRLNFSALDTATAAVIRETVPEVAIAVSGSGGPADDRPLTPLQPTSPVDGSSSPMSHVQQAQQEFARRQSRMGSHVVALEDNIAAKLKLVEVLVSKNREMERLKRFYDVKLREMNEQMAAASRERDRLQHELTKVGPRAARARGWA